MDEEDENCKEGPTTSSSPNSISEICNEPHLIEQCELDLCDINLPKQRGELMVL
jgi:hypothetical protein